MFEFLSHFFQNKSPQSLVNQGKFLGTFLYRLFPYRKKVITQNIELLKHSFPDDHINTEQIVRLNYQHMATLFLEGLVIPGLTEKELKNYITFEDGSELDRQLKAEKSAVILLGHIGNWEFLASGIGALLGEPVYFVTKKLTSKSTNRFMHKMRESFQNRMVPMEYSRDVLGRLVSEGCKIGMAGDQSAHVESYWDKFLGVPVPIFLGAASFALKSNSPLYLLVPIRNEDGTFTIYGEKIKSDDLDPTKKESLYTLTTRHTRALENYIRRFPDQYYWIHKRWKHAGKAENYYPKYHSN